MQISTDLEAAVRSGEPGAFDEFVRETSRIVYTLCYRILGNSQDAQDATQEVYVRAWRGLQNFRGDSSLGTWLHRIAVNTSLTAMRKRGRVPVPTLPEDLAESGPQVRDPAEADLHLLEAAIAKLKPEDRAVIVLKDIEGWSCEEVGDAIGATEGAVKIRVFRARQKLAETLSASGLDVPARKGSR